MAWGFSPVSLIGRNFGRDFRNCLSHPLGPLLAAVSFLCSNSHEFINALYFHALWDGLERSRPASGDFEGVRHFCDPTSTPLLGQP